MMMSRNDEDNDDASHQKLVTQDADDNDASHQHDEEVGKCK